LSDEALEEEQEKKLKKRRKTKKRLLKCKVWRVKLFQRCCPDFLTLLDPYNRHFEQNLNSIFFSLWVYQHFIDTISPANHNFQQNDRNGKMIEHHNLKTAEIFWELFSENSFQEKKLCFFFHYKFYRRCFLESTDS
jgi:hypothetical protein